MSTRTTESTVTFERPFTLASQDGQFPAGTYLLVVDEELIEGVSFPAYRRTATTLHTPAVAVRSGTRQAHPIAAAELDAALEADARSRS
ncbi:MAG: hypothetical protein JNK11_03375 [Alphaproteobacteria bacterium]|nr:hypothetical protein [Alphaproteobacteria bacterium]